VVVEISLNISCRTGLAVLITMNPQPTQTANGYDQFGKEYHSYRKSAENFYNSMIDMPAVLSFLEDINGKKILDIGCGSGLYSAILQQRGAVVTGIDISKTMLQIARQEVKDAKFHFADITDMSFPDKSFDFAMSALMLGYVENWDQAFKEVRRILKPGGIFIFSIFNPVLECREEAELGGKKYKIMGNSKDNATVIGDYFNQRWFGFKLMKNMESKSHHKTYETIINTILQNGFSIEGYKDAKPIAQGKTVSPLDYEKYSKLPIFCVFKVKKK